MTANGVGYELQRQAVTVSGDRVSYAEFGLTPLTLRAGSGPTLPRPLAEASAQDIVLENGAIAIAIAAVTEDGQLSPTTRGKPRDLAARGFADQLDWMNLPYASLAQPRGGNAWRGASSPSPPAETPARGRRCRL